VTQEFHISVTPVRNDEYLVRTEEVPSGGPLAEEQVVWNVDHWLTLAHQLMDDPLLGLLQGYEVSRVGGFELPLQSEDLSQDRAASPLSLVDLGQELFSALFQGTLRDSWLTAQGIAQHRGEVLRLRLGLKGSRLSRLPWEVLQAGDGAGERPRSSLPSRPLATGTDVIFSRYQPGIGLATGLLPIEPDQPLRILMAIAAPTDQDQLNLKREASHLQQELRDQDNAVPEGAVGSLPNIQLTILEQPGREQLTQALEQGRYQVFHFAGHSNLGVAGGSLYLVNHKTGLTETLSGDDLAGLLANNHIQMAVFNSCRGAYTAAAEPMAELEDHNLAAALVGRGIPAVLAMAERIPDDVALTLTRLFYRNLKQGYPVDLSLSRARQGLISAYGSHQLYWALPILYLHPKFDGYLTSGDRTLDNPADRVLRSPHLSNRSDADEQQPDQEWAIDSENLFPEDELGFNGLLDDLEYTDALGELTSELNNDDDRFVVSDLIQQLTQQQPEDEQPLPASKDEHLWAEVSGSELQMYDKLPENPHYRPTDSGKTTPAPAIETKPDRPSGSQILRRLNSRAVPISLGAAGLLAIVALPVFWFMSYQSTQQSDAPPDLTAVQTLVPADGASPPDTAALEQTETPALTAIAIEHFNQNEIAAGERAVAALLERNALLQAGTALAAVPSDRVDSPGISFLRGRLAWHSIIAGNTDYSTDDVRRYWEYATQGQPGSPQYHKALGFAYYAEGNSGKAIQAWLKTLALLQAQASGQAIAADQTSDVDVALPTQLLTGKDALTAYAGIALALLQASDQPASSQREDLVSKSVKLYQMVNDQDPVGFQPTALAQPENWLWTEAAIQNWQKLSTLER
jgi:hypothetical protein